MLRITREVAHAVQQISWLPDSFLGSSKLRLSAIVKRGSRRLSQNTTLSDSRCQIDHRSRHTPTEPPDQQAKRPSNEASKASTSRPSEPLGGGLAASYVAASLNGPIVIWYGEELTA
jgi:hypothetical protein